MPTLIRSSNANDIDREIGILFLCIRWIMIEYLVNKQTNKQTNRHTDRRGGGGGGQIHK